MWCSKILAQIYLRDDGVRQVVYDRELCTFEFKGGQCSLIVQDAMIESCVFGYNDTSTSHSRDSPSMFEEKVKIIIEEFHYEVEAQSD